MVHKSALLHLLHRCIIVAFCLIIMLTLLLSTMLFVKRQQASTENQSLQLSHMLIKQMAYSLAPLINNYDHNTSDNNKQILSSLELLVKNDWLLDVSVYLINGQLIASAGETVPARDRLHLDDYDASTINKKTDQIIQCVELQGRPIGFIRFTVDNSLLKPSENTIERVIHIIWGILILAVVIGFILAKALQRHHSINLTSLPKQQSNGVISFLSTERILNDMPDNDLPSDYLQNTLDTKDKQHHSSDRQE